MHKFHSFQWVLFRTGIGKVLIQLLLIRFPRMTHLTILTALSYLLPPPACWTSKGYFTAVVKQLSLTSIEAYQWGSYSDFLQTSGPIYTSGAGKPM